MKKNKEAVKILQRVYNNLARSVDAAADLQLFFQKKKDKRASKAKTALDRLIKVQELLNPLAEDDDIRIM